MGTGFDLNNFSYHHLQSTDLARIYFAEKINKLYYVESIKLHSSVVGSKRTDSNFGLIELVRAD